MKSVYKESRKVGDAITVVDVISGHNTPTVVDANGKITHMTKKFVTVQYNGSIENRFHRATGLVVGFAYPTFTRAIAPETSKEIS
jgi:hypothetical protein